VRLSSLSSGGDWFAMLDAALKLLPRMERAQRIFLQAG
jgi:hypothetical protein